MGCFSVLAFAVGPNIFLKLFGVPLNAINITANYAHYGIAAPNSRLILTRSPSYKRSADCKYL
jgi:hypothetical protein